MIVRPENVGKILEQFKRDKGAGRYMGGAYYADTDEVVALIEYALELERVVTLQTNLLERVANK